MSDQSAPPTGEELSARCDEIARRWLSCERTSAGQFDFYDDPLRPGENP